MEASKIDLIVTGTRGRSGVGKLLMGSVAEKIFRRASCPMLTVGPSVSGERESIVDLHAILFATDFSTESMAALPYAISLTVANNARLYILHVCGMSAREVDKNALKDKLLKLIPKQVNFMSLPKMIVEYGRRQKEFSMWPRSWRSI